MDVKGVCYEVGRAYSGYFLTRRVFDPATTRRELQIIRDDLHCNAARCQGTDVCPACKYTARGPAARCRRLRW